MSKPLHTWKIAVGTIPLSVLNATPRIPALGGFTKRFKSRFPLHIISMCAVVCSYCMPHQHLDAI